MLKMEAPEDNNHKKDMDNTPFALCPSLPVESEDLDSHPVLFFNSKEYFLIIVEMFSRNLTSIFGLFLLIKPPVFLVK